MFKVKVKTLRYYSPLNIFDKVKHLPGSILMHSGEKYLPIHRYSYIFCFPEKIFTGKELESSISELKAIPSNLLLEDNNKYGFEFAFGIAGYFSYELVNAWENITLKKSKLEEFPFCEFGYYYSHVVFDNLEKKTYICASNYNGHLLPCDAALDNRIKQLVDLVEKQKDLINHKTNHPRIKFKASETRINYQKKITQVIKYIKQGDIFQANISQQFKASTKDSISSQQLWSYFLNLTKNNSAPMSGFYNLPEVNLVSCSPERFIKVSNKIIATEPIKGTARRSKIAILDWLNKLRLRHSSKNLAENTMIVDLMRNDLSKVCIANSIKVHELCKLNSFAAVHHLISKISGKIIPGTTSYDILAACFPAGSITGAPKIRAMEIIDELEDEARGPYCGAAGYIDFRGNLDLAVLIRTICATKNKTVCNVGGGIVSDSNASAEYQETLDKASKLI